MFISNECFLFLHFRTGIVTVLSLAAMYQAMGVDVATTHNMQEAVIKIPANVWASYSEVLAKAPIQTKAVTSATVYTIGDLLSQKTEGRTRPEFVAE